MRRYPARSHVTQLFLVRAADQLEVLGFEESPVLDVLFAPGFHDAHHQRQDQGEKKESWFAHVGSPDFSLLSTGAIRSRRYTGTLSIRLTCRPARI